MPKKLTVAEQAIVAKASQDLYQYEKTCEEHSAVLRKDLEGLTKAHQEYTANSNPMGFTPPRDEFDHYIEESEKVLKKECKTLLDHLHVVYAAYFLCRLLMRKMSEHGERVHVEFIRRKVELDKQYPYVFPPESPSVVIPSEPVPSDYRLTRLLVMNLPRVSLQETDLIQYQRHPELLQRETFVSFRKMKQSMKLSVADEGPEAVSCSSINLFDLLRTSERVLKL
ncbi:hypothetical protein BGW80DRAFT_1329859 [Lactifluus volemus]|nr:hypothetical protein BGW80DRAFT_1329859 [Lactifluus volemus]